MNVQDTVLLKWQMHIGADGTDKNSDNPLSASLTKLFSKKSDQNFRLAMCFFDAGKLGMRWFGVFVHTAGGRILFFPGTSVSTDKIEGYQGEKKHWDQYFEFDHISLEKGRKRWHVTTKASKDHLGNPRTLDLSDNRNLWFGLTIESSKVLKILHKETLVSFQSPPSDSERRMYEFNKSRKGMEFPLLSISEDIDEFNSSSYQALHFTIIAGQKGFDYYMGENLALPYGGPYIEHSNFDHQSKMLSKTFKLSISDNTDLQIICNIIPGKMKVPFSISGQEEANRVAEGI